MANWDHLPEGILLEIIKRVPTYDDFEAIREVNHHWRSSSRGFPYSCPTPQVPWLMLATENPTNGCKVVDEGRLYSLTKDCVRHIKLPNLTRRARFFSSRGWLLTVSCRQSFSLVNPFSKCVIHLPKLLPCEKLRNGTDWKSWIESFALSSSPSNDEEDYTVVVTFGSWRTLAFWRPGDSDWTISGEREFYDVIYSGEVFYGIQYDRKVMAFKLDNFWDETLRKKGHRMLVHCVGDMDALYSKPPCGRHYLVWSQDKLLVICRMSEWGQGYTRKVLLDELNVHTGEVATLKDLGNRSLFLGFNESIVLEDVKGCKSNCIYFTDNDWVYWPEHAPGGQNMGIYNLSDDSFEPFYKGQSLSYVNPPLWIECKT